MKSPFKFLDAFTLKDKGAFFGREEETEALYSMVFKTPLLMIYGLSGTGKTSLIQCGLAGKFDGPDWYPFYLRRGEDINKSLDEALHKAIPPGEKTSGNLVDHVSLLFRYYLRPVYIIIDQFEELFILGNADEQTHFAQRISQLIDAELPCKILFVIREEFIGQLYPLEKIIPTLYDYRLRLEPMGFKKVEAVIGNSCAAFNITLEKPERNIQDIYDNISAGKSGVQLPYLQVYLDMLYREDFERTYPKLKELPEPLPPLEFTTEEIKRFGRIEDVLGRFLNQQITQLESQVKRQWPKAPEKAVFRVLDVFVTEQGTKRPIQYELMANEKIELEPEITSWLTDIPADAVSFICSNMASARLLRQSDETIELAHDALAALIDNRRSDQQRRQNEVFNRLLTNFTEFKETNEYLTRRQLNALEEYLPLLESRLGADVKNFIAESIQKADDAEHAALLEERKKRKNARRIAIAGFSLALLTFIAAGVAIKETLAVKKANQLISEKAFQVQIQYAENLKLEGKYDEALEELERLRHDAYDIRAENKQLLDSLSTTWPQVASLMQKGDELRVKKEYKKALEYYNKALSIGSDHRIISTIAETEQDLEKAFADKLAAATDFLLANQIKIAISTFEECLLLKPGNIIATERLEKAKKLMKR